MTLPILGSSFLCQVAALPAMLQQFPADPDLLLLNPLLSIILGGLVLPGRSIMACL